MASARSRQKLLEFLDYLGEKGLMAKNTVASRKAAAGKVLSILSEQEAEDVTKLDLASVMGRFSNLQGKGYTPGSLITYYSRTKSAVDDFGAYLDNPLGFKTNVQLREKRKPEAKKESQSARNSGQFFGGERSVAKSPLSNSLLPIPIRSDITVYVQGLPFDLTEQEANKIANVIRAMATST